MEEDLICESIPFAWAKRMPDEVRDLAQGLQCEVCEMRKSKMVFPPAGHIYSALRLTPPEKVKAVIIGQDPYPTAGAANGLAFSVNPEVKIPASLRNIFKELSSDLNCPLPTCGDLTPWAEQGVLLLNSVLTVEEGKPASHAKLGWQRISEEILKICMQTESPVVFLLWGRYAMEAAKRAGVAPGERKAVICSSHPSPLGATKATETIPAFLGSRPFSTANSFLRDMGSEEIHWEL